MNKEEACADPTGMKLDDEKVNQGLGEDMNLDEVSDAMEDDTDPEEENDENVSDEDGKGNPVNEEDGMVWIMMVQKLI